MQPNVDRTTEPIEQMLDKIGVQAVFGPAIIQAGVTIIPVAQVTYGFGYGSGYGSGYGPDKDETRANSEAATPAAITALGETHGGEGGGRGAGAAGRATPYGFIRITPEGATYEAISDNTRIPLAGILFAAWAVFWITATIRTITQAVAKTRQLKNKG